jgi:predicted transcriptional regulator
MTTRPWVLLALLATLLLAPPAVAAGSVHIPTAHAGDRATYGSGEREPVAVALEWLQPRTTQDPWGQAVSADILRIQVPAKLLNPRAEDGAWFDLSEAYAGPGSALLWRQGPLDRSWLTMAEVYRLPLFLLTEPATLLEPVEPDLSTTIYDPSPYLRSCLAHHGLQGRSVAEGIVVPLATLCPGLAPLAPAASARPARATTFQGHAATEFVYDLEGGASPADLALPAGGTLRFVLADGLPFVAEAQASTVSQSQWRFTLTGFAAGKGPVVPAPQAGSRSPEGLRADGLRFEPLGDDGPADDGSGLPYLLEDAIANVQRDPKLAGFHAWQRQHPQAFLTAADFGMGVDSHAERYARWLLVFGEPRADAGTDVFTVLTQRTTPPPTSNAGQPASFVASMEHKAEVQQFPVERPRGQPAVDIASAMAAWDAHGPAASRHAPVSRVFYVAPAPGEPALLGVERGMAGSAEAPRAAVVLDASNGAAARVVAYSFAPVGYTAPPASLPGIEFAALTVAAVLAVVLAKSGYFAVLYSRLRHGQLLDNPNRRFVYELIRRRPGMHFKAIAHDAGFGNGATAYHLRVLERGHMITAVALRGYRRYYLSGTVPHGELRGRAELEAGSARRAYDAVRSQPGITLSELARRVQVSPPAAHKTVERLHGAGLLEKSVRAGDGHRVRFTAREPNQN